MKRRKCRKDLSDAPLPCPAGTAPGKRSAARGYGHKMIFFGKTTFRCSLHPRRAANALRKMVKKMLKVAFPFVPKCSILVTM
jgi:hypothetical protein